MKRYVYNRRGVFTGRVLSVTKFSTFPARSTATPPPPLQAGEWACWRGGVWQVVTELPISARAINRAIEVKKLKLALFDLNLLDDVTAHISSLPQKIKQRIKIELDNGGDITYRQARKLLKDVIDDKVIKQIFIGGG